MSPIVTRDMGEIAYVDHASTPDLQEWYRHDPNVDVDRIVEVSYIWGESSLEEAIGPDKKFDYVIASHVVEHVPDMITWLQEIAAVLKPGGVLSLAIPDKRYTFDVLRRETVPADLIEAYTHRSRKPSSGQIFDHYSMVVDADTQKIWKGELGDHTFRKKFTLDKVIGLCREASEDDKYIDTHCWVLTPYSFIENLKMLVRLDLLDFEMAKFDETVYAQLEFFVTLRKLDRGLPPEQRQQHQLESFPDVQPPESTEALQARIAQQDRLIAVLTESRSRRLSRHLREAAIALQKRLRADA